jgi:hypothetical protein
MTPQRGETGTPARLSMLVTVAALALMGVHLALPSANIDGTTLALLAFALLPWLAPLVKTIDLGGVKFELRDFRKEVTENLTANRERVEALADRVDKLAVAFSGAVTPELADTLSTELGAFHSHLADAGIPLPETPPSVAIDEGLEKTKNTIAYYDHNANSIHIDSKYADDADIILREYTHHILLSPLSERPDGDDTSTREYERFALEYALADYFPCSFRNEPVLYRKTAARVGDSWPGTNLANDSRFGRRRPRDFSAVFAEANAWGATFWRARTLLSQQLADTVLFTLWRGANAQHQDIDFRTAVGHMLATSVAEQFGEETGAQMKEMLRGRGLTVKT